MSSRQPPKKFLVSFSFAGEQRDLVRSIAEAVEAELGRGTVFYDDWFEPLFSGADGDLRLQRIYKEDSVLVVPCISSNYAIKPWTRDEQDAIRSFRRQIRNSCNPAEENRLLPLRVGEGEVEGLTFDHTITQDVRNLDPVDTARLIVERLRMTKRVVYLAEGVPDRILRTKRKQLRNFLADCGWHTIAADFEDEVQYSSELSYALRDSIAFVQILSDIPWSPLPLDAKQYESARALIEKPNRIFSYRNPEFDWEEIDDVSHQSYIEGIDAIESGFEDFKVHLEKKLEELWVQESLPEVEEVEDTEDDLRPFVQVVIRASDPDEIWEQIFELQDEWKLDFGEFPMVKETPCHGFLVVCDEAAMQDENLSTRDVLYECREMQMSQDPASGILPVGLFFWPPPVQPRWAKLLRVRPGRLTQIVGMQDEQSLSGFFDDVRQLAVDSA